MNEKNSEKSLITSLCLVMSITTLLPKLTTFSYHVQFEQSKTIWELQLNVYKLFFKVHDFLNFYSIQTI
jgi:hypothetical protein